MKKFLVAMGLVAFAVVGCDDSSSASAGSNGEPSVESSSSSVTADETGSMTDSRDGKTYRTVKIGDQVWMAENLNYAYYKFEVLGKAFTSDSISWCYGNDPANCTKYGRLYTWGAAMDSVGKWSTNGKGCGYTKTCSPTYPVRGVCPDGWHLPTKADFETLFTAVGGKSTEGKVLKSTSGWNSSGNGTDAYSFSALPAGHRYDGGYYRDGGYHAYFWSSTEIDSYHAYYMSLYCRNDAAYLNDDYSKYYGFSVRCVKDDGSTTQSSSFTKISSSSDTSESSSSEAKLSSSSVTPQSSDSETSVSTGTMTDSRDGQTYKTVTIGTQTWMAENLNYETGNSYCYNDADSNCTKYGRLYTWAAAMDSVGKWSTNGKGCGFKMTCSPTYPVRGVCPDGWHLPTKAEFETLFTAVGGKSTACQKLKAASGWIAFSGITNEDAFGFSALPAGYRLDFGYYDYEGYYAYFWSSTEYNIDSAYYIHLYYDNDDAHLDNHGKYYGFSVRCVKD